jgi:hypothetical protein
MVETRASRVVVPRDAGQAWAGFSVVPTSSDNVGMSIMQIAKRRRRPVIALGSVLAAASLWLSIDLAATGFYRAGRQALEPFSAAEERCQDVDPEHPTGSPRWHECVERETARSPGEVSGSHFNGAAAAGLVFGGALLIVAFETARPSVRALKDWTDTVPWMNPR